MIPKSLMRSYCVLVLLLGTGSQVAFAQTAAAQNKIGRDWGKYPAIVQIDTSEDIFAIGDVHGDYDRLMKLLQTAGIIERDTGAWIGGRAVLVFTGDLIDKGPHSLKVVQLVESLQTAAAAKGGRVVVLMGNHEAEFLADPAEKKVRDFAQDLRGAGIAPSDVSACRGEVGQFLCSLPFGARVDDWFFSHGGNTGGRTMAQLTADFEAGVGKDGFGSRQLVGENSMLEARLGQEGPHGKSWFDAEAPQRSTDQLLGRYAAALGVNHLVQGHQHKKVLFDDGQQRNAGQMFQWHGLMFLIDVGMSEGVGDSQGAVLHIESGNREKAVAIGADGTQTSLWKSQRRTAAASR
jgi:Calcineurin-like phosphoesterase